MTTIITFEELTKAKQTTKHLQQWQSSLSVANILFLKT